MEGNKKNLISTFLLAVGVIFILVAGGIFVTTAWQYLPEFMKQLALLVVAGGMFAGSNVVSKRLGLHKISSTLYYLGVAFVGFFTVAIMGGVVREQGFVEANALKMLAACGAMLIPVSANLLRKNSVVACVIEALLVDGVILSSCFAFSLAVSDYIVFQGFYLLLLCLADSYLKSRYYNEAFKLTVAIEYLVHGILYGLMVTSYVMLAGNTGEMLSVFMVAMAVLVTYISWKVRQNTAIRVFNSLSLMWFVFVSVICFFEITFPDYEDGLVCLVILLINSGIMVFINRKEVKYIQMATAVVVPYIQLIGFSIDAWLFDGNASEWSTVYYPYSLVFGVAFLVQYMMVNRNADIRTWKQNFTLKFAALQMLNGIVLWITAKNYDCEVMTFYLLATISLLTVASFFKKDNIKRVFKTLAIGSFLLAILGQTLIEISNQYIVEWNCFLIVVGIVLFRIVWYDKREQLSCLYYVVVCTLLGILLINNLTSGGIGNVMILGLVGIAILVVAALTNNKKYVIASSITLILLVLYLTRAFWLNIAWWVYLFAAGVGLVLLAIKKEKEA